MRQELSKSLESKVRMDVLRGARKLLTAIAQHHDDERWLGAYKVSSGTRYFAVSLLH